MNKNTNLRILSIGDSFVEAVQVQNSDAFHGILNNYKSKSDQNINSTILAASGNALPQYLTHISFAKNNMEIKDSIIIVSIISNDFDESFSKYKPSVGTYFSSEKSNNLNFVDYKETNKLKLRRVILKNSAIARYIYFNLEPSNNIIHKYPICKLFG